MSSNSYSWQDRGYRQDLASLRKSPSEDPQGEIAYQRAFAEAAKKKPPRVPNPAFYPNSPSAQEYMKRKDQAVFSVRKQTSSTSPESTYQHSGQSSPRHKEDDFPPHQSGGHVTHIKTEQTAYTPRTNSHHQFSPTSAQHPEERGAFNPALPMTMEPRLDAAMGPARMLR